MDSDSQAPRQTPKADAVRGRAIGAAAVVLMFGNLVGSLFGFVRQSTIAGVFGESAKTDAFFAASIVPQMFYDLVIGAAVSAALIPVFTEIIERRGRDDLWAVVGTVLTIVWIVLACLIAVLVAVATPLMSLLLHTYPNLHTASAPEQAVPIVRVLVLTLFFLGTSAVLTATLFSLRKFTVPAFAPCLYHIGIVAGAVTLKPALGIMALPIGAVAGAASQTVVQASAVLRERPKLSFRLALSPDVRHILRLYAPIAAGLLVSIAGQVIDIEFKASLGVGPITAMNYATTLVQFPIGIAVAAMSFAVLPSISSDAAFQRMDQFKDTLASGMRLVLFLTIPSAVGLIALSTPIVSLVYQHHALTPIGTARAATALVGYSFQIPFVGVDQMLIFAFYARRDTLTPMLVGVLGVTTYLISAWLLSPRFGILGLALANTLQNSLHALVLLVLLTAAVGGLSGRGLVPSIARSLLAAVVMGTGAASLSALIRAHVTSTHLAGQAATALVPLAFALILYVGTTALLRSPELAFARDIALRKRPVDG